MKILPKNSKEATVSKLNEMQFKNLFDHPLSLICYRTGLHCAKSRVFGANRSKVGRANSKNTTDVSAASARFFICVCLFNVCCHFCNSRISALQFLTLLSLLSLLSVKSLLSSPSLLFYMFLLSTLPCLSCFYCLFFLFAYHDI